MRTEIVGDMVLRSVGHGAPVLWVHGLGESGLCFEEVVQRPELGGFEHWLVDLPGYGRSAWQPPCSLEDTVAAVEPVLQRLGSCIVVGHSMGGVLAVMLAERFGVTRVRAVVNIEGNLSLGDCQYSSRVVSTSFQDYLQHGRELLLNSLYQMGISDEAHRGYYASMRLAQPNTVYLHSQNLVEVSRSETMIARMKALELPLLYLAGYPRGICERSLNLIRESPIEHELLSPAGHWPFIDQPKEFADKLADWLRRV